MSRENLLERLDKSRIEVDDYWSYLYDTIGEVQEDITTLRELVYDLVMQTCASTTVPDKLDSMAISAYADAMRYLDTIGKIVITEERGRRVIAHLPGDDNGDANQVEGPHDGA